MSASTNDKIGLIHSLTDCATQLLVADRLKVPTGEAREPLNLTLAKEYVREAAMIFSEAFAFVDDVDEKKKNKKP